MPVAKIIIFSGPPCTGKTCISKALAEKFHLPIIRRGLFREMLFDIYGWGSWNLYKKNKDASRELMYWLVVFLLKCNQSFILDGVLRWKENGRRLRAIQKKYKFKALQFNFFADGAILRRRFEKRLLSGERHPGYGRYVRSVGMCRKLSKGRSQPLKVSGKTITIDTTDFSKVDYRQMSKEVENFLLTS